MTRINLISAEAENVEVKKVYPETCAGSGATRRGR